MKKTLVAIILIVCMMIAMIPAVSAANLDAFDYIELNGSTETYIDDPETNDQGGCGLSIQFVDGYGCGYSSLNDIVAFYNVDFGKTGSKSLSLVFAYGQDKGKTTDLEFYMDAYDDEAMKVGEAKIGFTGGWTINDAQELTFPCEVDPGVHDIFIKFTTGNSGSFSKIKFYAEEHVDEETSNQMIYEGEPIKDPTVLDIFNDQLKLAFISPNKTDVSFVDGCVKLTATEDTGDPFVTFALRRYYAMMNIENENMPSADEYFYLVMKVKADSAIYGTTFELFGCCDDVTDAGPESAFIRSEYDATDDWTYILFDFAVAPSWYGGINNIRLDWNIGCAEGDSMLISEMRFFKDEDEAQNFIDGIEGPVDTTAKTDATTKAEDTTVKEEATTVADDVTAAKADDTTKAEENKGCGGMIALPACLVSLVLGAAVVTKKKKF